MNPRYFLWQLRRWLGFGIVYLSLTLGVTVLVPFLIKPDANVLTSVFSTSSLVPLYFGSAFAVLMAGLTRSLIVTAAARATTSSPFRPTRWRSG